ncbi:hypothetical protein [Bradyrhizobium sp. SZCCHNS3053]|nr:hypothetical protein [Bradyrhizobium sp. SZCCHNS3053]
MKERHNRRRRLALIRILSDMSRGDWAEARYADYHPIEAELAKLDR